ncbi:cytidine deaminase [Sansalvadorimonas sp. 2012CJ34-2]|uniref:Cytidine deaminase n=2 Tax=Parendozoicomonas callyspongiae TaxID=2942213 RepID=A0ABT0PB69_9GAMM|nr:cytidine deaminase [Sansalvadorimonas sp. 2012CJ34-2]
MLTAEQADELASILSISIDKLPEMLLPVAAATAVVPVSHFHVGVVIRGGSGALYLGSNMEFDKTFLGMSLHGEQSAVNNAWLHGETSIINLVVNAAPCGHCRQFLHEIGTSEQLDVNIVSSAGESNRSPLTGFLPSAFGPVDLGVDGGILSYAKQTLKCEEKSELVQLALEAANSSYAPYSKGFAAIALETTDGVKVCGRYAENAAYNPSLQPMTSAIAHLRFASLGKDVEIKNVVLVETDSPVSHATHLAALQKTVLKDVTVQRYLAS